MLWSSSCSLAMLHTAVNVGRRQGERSRGRVWFYTWWWRQQGSENTQEALVPRGEGAQGCGGDQLGGVRPRAWRPVCSQPGVKEGSRALLSAWDEEGVPGSVLSLG